MMDEVRRYLLKAEHALEVAEDLLKGGHAPDAASKIYYSMYYAAQALLNADWRFRTKPATDSVPNRPPVPGEIGH